ncbi:hypothetical protein DLJ53_15845 [Acuticoccus sediminis]|uniref:DUF3024 domain-containing protein n=1 Tax=Acuticoccus sediminis TaxID=2184697 RepID=A0A8B2NQX8_9HYPH|nr:hypothetical protein [Acuticoccus sediminis]RAI00720.1 hypothetical protein DLJ53_15845 [Acuticoccus sediminis]
MGQALPAFDILPAHPNPFDERRILRGLQGRRRYRYVEPAIVPVVNGYRIEAPCCSRTIDPDGGVIDIALLVHDPETDRWRLYRKDHAFGEWDLHGIYPRLVEILIELAEDDERSFWQ